MIDPSQDVLDAVIAALKADGLVGALVDDRIYDAVPKVPTFPYVSIGDVEAADDSDDCLAQADVTIDLHIWVREGGRPLAREIAKEVARTVDAPLAGDGFEVILQEVERTRHLRDPDNITAHSIVTVRFATGSTA